LFKFENCSHFDFCSNLKIVQISFLFKFENCSDFKFCSKKSFKKVAKKRKKKEEIPDGPWPSLPPVRAGCAARPSRAANGRRIGGPPENLPHLSEEASYWARLDCVPGSQANIFIPYW
jgi:hypothetical protein